MMGVPVTGDVSGRRPLSCHPLTTPVANGGFEVGNLDAWQVGGTVVPTLADVAHTGYHAVRIGRSGRQFRPSARSQATALGPSLAMSTPIPGRSWSSGAARLVEQPPGRAVPAPAWSPTACGPERMPGRTPGTTSPASVGSPMTVTFVRVQQPACPGRRDQPRPRRRAQRIPGPICRSSPGDGDRCSSVQLPAIVPLPGTLKADSCLWTTVPTRRPLPCAAGLRPQPGPLCRPASPAAAALGRFTVQGAVLTVLSPFPNRGCSVLRSLGLPDGARRRGPMAALSSRTSGSWVPRAHLPPVGTS